MLRVILASIILSLCIGSIYSWSIFIVPIQELTNLSLPEIQLVFCLAIFMLGFTTSFGSKKILSLIPYKASFIGSILFAAGMILTGIALSYGSPLIYLTYSILLGVGTGIIYLIPVPLLLQEFPNNKALGSSISILSFGFGSAIFVPLANLFPSIVDAFICLGICYGLLMLISTYLLHDKKYQYIDKQLDNSITVAQARKTKEFYYIFIMIFINIFVGISLISIAAPLATELLISTTIIVSLIGLFNGFGRPFWAFLADRVGYIRIYQILFIIQLFAVILGIINPMYITAALLIIASCYGAGFSCLPALCANIFGGGYAGEIFGTILFSWALAGFLGPMLITHIYLFIGSYFGAFTILASLYIIALLCSIKIRKLV